MPVIGFVIIAVLAAFLIGGAALGLSRPGRERRALSQGGHAPDTDSAGPTVGTRGQALVNSFRERARWRPFGS